MGNVSAAVKAQNRLGKLIVNGEALDKAPARYKLPDFECAGYFPDGKFDGKIEFDGRPTKLFVKGNMLLTPLALAIHHNNVKVVDQILTYQTANVLASTTNATRAYCTELTPLLHALNHFNGIEGRVFDEAASIEMIRLLMKEGANPNKPARFATNGDWAHGPVLPVGTPLATAARRGYTNCIIAIAEGAHARGGIYLKFHERSKFGFGTPEKTPLDWALAEGHMETAAVLRDLEAAQDLRMAKMKAPRTLGKACAGGDAAAVRKAVELGADVNADTYNEDGGLDAGGKFTAACVAVLNSTSWVGSNDAMLRDVLLPAPVSADPNKGNTKNGATLTHYAVAEMSAHNSETKPQSDVKTIQALVAHGADFTRGDIDGWTPIMEMAKARSGMALLRALAAAAKAHGVALDVNAVCHNRSTFVENDAGKLVIRDKYASEGRRYNDAGKTALDMAMDEVQHPSCNASGIRLEECQARVAFLRDELGARRADDVLAARLAEQKKRPKSATKQNPKEDPKGNPLPAAAPAAAPPPPAAPPPAAVLKRDGLLPKGD